MVLRDLIIDEASKYLRFVKPSGDTNIGGPCPFHGDGQEKRPSFYINTETGLFLCHSCGVRGPFSHFLKLVGASASKVALISELLKSNQVDKAPKAFDMQGQHYLSEGLLGVVDFCPVKLVDDGFDQDILQRLDVGFDREALRITFPIRDLYGNLVGLSGRTVVDAYPRYKVYRRDDFVRLSGGGYEAEIKYKNYDIKNHNYFWNMHNVWPSLFLGNEETLVIVEGYKACIWLIQCGVENVVALQGSSLSLVQENTLSKVKAKIIMYLDNNSAGRLGTLDTAKRLGRQGKLVQVVQYPDDAQEGDQPDTYGKTETVASLNAAKHNVIWRRKCNTQIQRDLQERNARTPISRRRR